MSLCKYIVQSTFILIIKQKLIIIVRTFPYKRVHLLQSRLRNLEFRLAVLEAEFECAGRVEEFEFPEGAVQIGGYEDGYEDGEDEEKGTYHGSLLLFE
jgi:hypothetical protein